MRLTTGTATLALAGVAALAAGCSSSSTSSAPVAPVHRVKPVVAAATPAPVLTPKQQLAKAMRTTLAAHTALFRDRHSVVYVKPPQPGEDANPWRTVAGMADFDHNRAVMYDVTAAHSAQPNYPDNTALFYNNNVFAGSTPDLVNSGVWSQAHASSCDNVDSLVDVLSFTKGPITVKKNVTLNGERQNTLYQVKVDIGRSLQDSCSASDRALGRRLVGQFVRQDVWVNGEGQIALQRWTLDPGQVQVPGVSASQVKAVVLTRELAGFGVKPVIPPHPTKVS